MSGFDQMDRTMLKGMAWERAKGELRSISHLFGHGDGDGFEQWHAHVEKFIKDTEDEGIGGFT